jgi:hypothetical protein
MKSDLERNIKASFYRQRAGPQHRTQIKQQLVARLVPTCRRYSTFIYSTPDLQGIFQEIMWRNIVDQRDLFSQPCCDRKRGRGAAQMNSSAGER